jgi:hypothetical protein
MACLLNLVHITRAHEPDLGYFLIQSQGSFIRVEAELPWTIRSAVYQFKPDLPLDATQKQLDQALFEYIQQHLVMIDDQGKPLPLAEVRPIKREGHTHQFDVEMLFQGTSVSILRNTLLWNVVAQPTHTHEVVHLFSREYYQTHRGQAEVIFHRRLFNRQGNVLLGGLIGTNFLVCLLFLTYRIRKRST